MHVIRLWRRVELNACIQRRIEMQEPNLQQVSYYKCMCMCLAELHPVCRDISGTKDSKEGSKGGSKADVEPSLEEIELSASIALCLLETS